MANLDHIGSVRNWGLMAGIELVENKKKNKPYAWQKAIGVKVCRLARDHGVILRPLGPVIVLMPPLCISETQMKKILRVTRRCIAEVTSAE